MIAALLLAASSGASATLTADYTVSVDTERPRVARVEARLLPGRDGLCLNRNAADTGLTHGWATFVHQLRATDAAGNAVELRYAGAGCWLTDASGPLQLSYEVLLQHDRFPNEPGDDELAYAGEWGQFWTGRALFIDGRDDALPQVRFVLPESWQITTPWPVHPGTPGSYRPADRSQLLDSALMLGTHANHAFRHGDVAVHLGLAGTQAQAQQGRLAALLTRALTDFGNLHLAPATGDLAVFLGQGRHYGGGVVGRSISMLIAGELPEAMQTMLTHIVTHEVFHLWNADLRYADLTRMYWFIEGSAEYYTLLAMLEQGHYDQAALLEQLRLKADSYAQALSQTQMSMVDAGSDKLNQYDLVYAGGTIAALALDLQIAEHSAGQCRLADILPELQRRFAPGAEAALDPEGLAELIRVRCRVDVSGLMAASITGRQPLPSAALLEQLAARLTQSH